MAVFVVLGIVFLILVVFCIANAVLSFIAREKQNKALYIINIVLGVASGVELNVVGAIFGLVTISRENQDLIEPTISL